ncbi:MAG: hypothetical protein RLY78_516 [Pseudomonadota bacterium]|jgi:sterol desaturase/sphingolipid hydroxylase (fatty acid hydroxylase superfamily)|uniref:Sterol desaturase family protein n=1 Tax=Pseudaquabacterium rugosum TaxID=2984194 RepID=A0ABU9BCW1_9BURK
MDDLQFGTRNKRGDWAPATALRASPIWPPQPARALSWLIGYLWPWNALFLASALLWWRWLIPDEATRRTLDIGWIGPLLVANMMGIALFYGAIEWRWYHRRAQDRRFKYNGRFPAEQPSDVFWFRSQNLDNALRTLLISVPIGTAIEVALLWGYANGWIAQRDWDSHPGQIIALVALAPVIHEAHFFVIHRAIHWGPLYRWVHAVHHNSVNPSPWSSLSMHPVESLAYFGVAAWVLVMAGHPFLAVWFFHLAGFGAVVGHIGFDKLAFGADGRPLMDTSAYAHYLHHKHFDVNYCDNGVLPLDVWTGSWHDGSPEGEARMQERFRRKRERMNTASS